MPSLDRFKLPPRAKRVPKMKQPDGIRMRYYSELLPLIRRMRQLTRERVLPMVATLVARHAVRVDQNESARLLRDMGINVDACNQLDAAVPAGHRARALIEGTARQLTKEWPNERLASIATQMGKKTSDFQKAQLFAQVRASIGIDIGTIVDRGIGARIAQFAAQNVSLIRSVQTKYFSDIEQIVLAGISDGSRASDISEDILGRVDVAESSALRIANDQIGKLTGQLNMVRQEQLGIDTFTWRTVKDNRVRPEHADLDGESFAWDDPPLEGIPGEPINCRCYAEPDLQGLIEGE